VAIAPVSRFPQLVPNRKSPRYATDDPNSLESVARFSKGICVNSTMGALIVPRMTTTQRVALSAVNGMIVYDTTTNRFSVYEDDSWVTKWPLA